MSLDWTGWEQRLNALRMKRGWSQRELGEKVGTSRNTVNRWEIGDRHPSMKALERLARSLDISMWMLLPTQGRGVAALDPDAMAPAIRFNFDIRILFPEEQAFSLPLARLMMATDDVRHLQRILIARTDRNDATPSERAIVEGEIAHTFRLLCGHLFEAIGAFATLDDRCRQLVNAAMAAPGADVERLRAKTALEKVRAARTTLLSKSGKRSLIRVVRNLVGFHYPDDQKLRSTIAKHERATDGEGRLQGGLIMTTRQGIGRYKVTDDITKYLIADELGGSYREFPRKYMEAIGEALDLAGALGDVVDYLLAHILAEHKDRIEQRDDVVRIPRAIVRERKALRTRRARMSAEDIHRA